MALVICFWHPTLTPLPVLQQGDVLKVDFGVHVNGRIVDSAFTMNFEHTYDKLLEAVKAATDTGIRVSLKVQYLTWLQRSFFLGGWYRRSAR